jgi:hypothetical protein
MISKPRIGTVNQWGLPAQTAQFTARRQGINLAPFVSMISKHTARKWMEASKNNTRAGWHLSMKVVILKGASDEEVAAKYGCVTFFLPYSYYWR